MYFFPNPFNELRGNVWKAFLLQEPLLHNTMQLSSENGLESEYDLIVKRDTLENPRIRGGVSRYISSQLDVYINEINKEAQRMASFNRSMNSVGSFSDHGSDMKERASTSDTDSTTDGRPRWPALRPGFSIVQSAVLQSGDCQVSIRA